jgi:hypothetical protein
MIARLLYACVLLAATCHGTRASDDAKQIAKEVQTNWKRLQGYELSMVADGVRNSVEYVGASYRLCVGFAKSDTSLPPYSFEVLRKNPGEPHLEEELIPVEALCFDGHARYGVFRRRLIGGEDPGYRPSLLEIYPDDRIVDLSWELFIRPMLLDLTFENTFSMFGTFDQLAKNTEFAVVGEQEFAGCAAKVLRLRNVDPQRKSDYYCDYIIVGDRYPTIVGIADSARPVRDYYYDINIEELLRVGDSFVPSKFSYVYDDPLVTNLECKVVSAKPLPGDFRGIWEFDVITGVKVIDERLEVTVVDFTDKEKADIMKFLGRTSLQPLNGSFRMTWILAAVIVTSVLVIAWRKSRAFL